jgi:transposase
MEASNRYYDKADETEAVFNVFTTLPPSQYTIQEISDRTGIPRRTLSNWRKQVKQQNDWRPTARRFHSNSRLLDDATELQIATFLRGTFISQGRDLSVNALRQQILMLVHDLVSTGKLPESKLHFKCSTTYMTRFLRRNGLSFRRGRPSRRPALDDDECFEFLVEFHVSLMSFATSAIVNFDESSWRLVMTSGRTVAERGTETVKCDVNGDTKAGFTFFASILADGTKPP